MSNVPGVPGGRTSLAGQVEGALAGGTIQDLGNGTVRFAMTFDASGLGRDPGSSSFDVSYGLTGQLVAHATVPEPAARLLLVAGILGLSAGERTTGGAPERRRSV